MKEMIWEIYLIAVVIVLAGVQIEMWYHIIKDTRKKKKKKDKDNDNTIN